MRKKGAQAAARIAAGQAVLIVLCLWLCPSPASGAPSGMKSVSAAGMRRLAIVRHGGSGSEIPFAVEIADNDATAEKGLSGRSALAGDQGMLFILGKLDLSHFWMKGMLFPLDILFFDRDKRLMGLLPDLQTCDACDVFRVPEGAAYALEVPAGTVKKKGIKTGDSFVFIGE